MVKSYISSFLKWGIVLKDKRIFLILIIISIFIVGCVDEFHRAEKLHQKAILENPNEESYNKLIEIYREKDEIEKLTETVESAINQGFPPEENQIYLDILKYYDSIDNKDKVENLINTTFGEISLPISLYNEFLLKDKLDTEMELMEMKCGDITGDNRNEIVVLMAKPLDGINMNYYEKIKLQVYNLKGDIIYEDEEEGGYFLYPKTAIVDLNYDGVKDLYYNVISDSITNANTMAKVVSLKDNNIDLIYSDGIEEIDIEIEITNERAYRIYSEKMNQSYDIILNQNDRDLSLNEELEPLWWEVYESIVKDDNGKEIIQINFEIKEYGMIQVNYGYKDGRIIPVNFKIEPIDR